MFLPSFEFRRCKSLVGYPRHVLEVLALNWPHSLKTNRARPPIGLGWPSNMQNLSEMEQEGNGFLWDDMKTTSSDHKGTVAIQENGLPVPYSCSDRSAFLEGQSPHVCLNRRYEDIHKLLHPPMLEINKVRDKYIPSSKI